MRLREADRDHEIEERSRSRSRSRLRERRRRIKIEIGGKAVEIEIKIEEWAVDNCRLPIFLCLFSPPPKRMTTVIPRPVVSVVEPKFRLILKSERRGSAPWNPAQEGSASPNPVLSGILEDGKSAHKRSAQIPVTVQSGSVEVTVPSVANVRAWLQGASDVTITGCRGSS